jgi:hypothetical protein
MPRGKPPAQAIEWQCTRCREYASGVTESTADAGQRHADESRHPVRLTRISTAQGSTSRRTVVLKARDG